MKTINSLAILVAAHIFLFACTANSQSQDANKSEESAAMSLKIETLYKSTQCGPSVPTQWIADQSQFEKLFQGSRQQMISPGSLAPTSSIDFSKYGVLLVSMGQQRTGGYSVELAREAMQVSDGVAQISVHWREPAPDMMLTQALTHPCIFLKVAQGDYNVVRVVDQENRVRAEITLK
jgi:hypothetical protein